MHVSSSYLLVSLHDLINFNFGKDDKMCPSSFHVHLLFYQCQERKLRTALQLLAFYKTEMGTAWLQKCDSGNGY